MSLITSLQAPLAKLVRWRGLPDDAEEWSKDHDAEEWSKGQNRSGPSTIPQRHGTYVRYLSTGSAGQTQPADEVGERPNKM